MCVLPPSPPQLNWLHLVAWKKNSQNVRLSHTAPLGGYIYFSIEALIKTIYPWLFLSAFPSLCLQTLLCSLKLVFSSKSPASSSLSFLHLFLLWPYPVSFLFATSTPANPVICNSLLGIAGEAGAETRFDVCSVVSPTQCLVAHCLGWSDVIKCESEIPAVVSITVRGVGWDHACWGEQNSISSLPAIPWLVAVEEVDLLALFWWIILWSQFTCVPCFLSGSTRSICLVRKVCAAVGGKNLIAKNTKPLFPNLLLPRLWREWPSHLAVHLSL